MSSQTLERAFLSALDALGDTIRMDYDRVHKALPNKPESPIEEAMLAGLIGYKYLFPFVWFDGGRPIYTSVDGAYQGWRVIPQCQIGDYRVDFAVEVWAHAQKAGVVIIECDGHEFHERTKEQAQKDKSRDRYLALQGHTVLRFTGREIFKEVMACVDQVMHACIMLVERLEKNGTPKEA